MILVCHVISQDHVIKKVMRLHKQEPINVSYHTTKSGGHRDCGGGDIVVLIYHMILKENVIKGLCDCIGKLLSYQVWWP